MLGHMKSNEVFWNWRSEERTQISGKGSWSVYLGHQIRFISTRKTSTINDSSLILSNRRESDLNEACVNLIHRLIGIRNLYRRQIYP